MEQNSISNPGKVSTGHSEGSSLGLGETRKKFTVRNEGKERPSRQKEWPFASSEPKQFMVGLGK